MLQRGVYERSPPPVVALFQRCRAGAGCFSKLVLCSFYAPPALALIHSTSASTPTL